MAEHTPGPWQVEDVLWLQDGRLLTDEEFGGQDKGADYLVSVGTDWDHVALCYGDENARLIAAAPELRKALSSLLHLWQQEAQLNRAAGMCRGEGRHARPGYDCPACDAAALLERTWTPSRE